MSLLNGIKSFGGNLLDVAKRFGEMQYAPDSQPDLEAAAGPQAAVIRKQYDRNYRNLRGQAIRNGARWYEMDDMAAAPANVANETALTRAIQIADALKERRLQDGRTAAIKGTLEAMTDLTPDQRRLVEALPYDQQAKVLTAQLFPKLNPNSTATAGTVVGQFKGANGHIWNVVQTGDPKDPVHSIDTGVADDRRPSEIRTLQSYEDNPQHLETRRARAFEEKYGTQAGEFQSQVQSTLPVVMQESSNAIMRLEALDAQLEGMPTGRMVGPALEKVNAEMQAINSAFTAQALQVIGQLKSQGISLNPITVEEMKVLFSTSPNVNNLPAANRKIIRRQIDVLHQIMQQAGSRLDWIDSGNPALMWRPQVVQPKGSTNSSTPPPPPGFELEQ